MTEHDENSSVDDDALVSAQTEGMENAPAPSPQPEDRTGRLQQLIRDKRAAEALAASSAARPPRFENGPKAAAAPRIFAPPKTTRAPSPEQAVREVGTEILARQASQAAGDCGPGSAGCLGGIDRRLPREGARFRRRRS